MQKKKKNMRGKINIYYSTNIICLFCTHTIVENMRCKVLLKFYLHTMKTWEVRLFASSPTRYKLNVSSSLLCNLMYCWKKFKNKNNQLLSLGGGGASEGKFTHQGFVFQIDNEKTPNLAPVKTSVLLNIFQIWSCKKKKNNGTTLNLKPATLLRASVRI